jgi:hypothetical protein
MPDVRADVWKVLHEGGADPLTAAEIAARLSNEYDESEVLEALAHLAGDHLAVRLTDGRWVRGA